MTEDGLTLLAAWARDGLTYEQIAKNMGIACSTLRVWKDTYSAISAALKKNRELADIEVENELYESCKGRRVTVKKPIKVKKVHVKDGERFEAEIVEQHEEEIYIPPNTTAQIFWLKNRRPDLWRDKRPETNNEQALERLDEVLKKIGGVDNALS